MPRRRPSSDRRRAVRRDVLRSLALVAAIFVSILSLPLGAAHERVCVVAARMVGHEVPCGLSRLSITLDTHRLPRFSVSLERPKLPISL